MISGSERALLESSILRRFLVRVLGDFRDIPAWIRCQYLAQMVASLDLKSASVCDVGCGKGIQTFYLARTLPQATILAIDCDPKRIEECAAVSSKFGYNNVRFELVDIVGHKLQTPFDLIVCLDVLEHIEDDNGVLDSFYGWLKDGGSLVLHVPQTSCKRSVLSAESLPHDGHVRDGYTISEMTERLQQAGFIVDETLHTFVPVQMIAMHFSLSLWMFRWKILRSLGLLAHIFVLVACELGMRFSGEQGSHFAIRAHKGTSYAES